MSSYILHGQKLKFTLATGGLEEPFFQLCWCVSFCSGGK